MFSTLHRSQPGICQTQMERVIKLVENSKILKLFLSVTEASIMQLYYSVSRDAHRMFAYKFNSYSSLFPQPRRRCLLCYHFYVSAVGKQIMRHEVAIYFRSVYFNCF